MNILNSYLRSKLDLSPLGFQRGEKESGYFCTPVLSKVIGWAGVDGIHFCTTRAYGELIFAVSPANCPGEYVHPVARNFEDFLRLLLACYDTAAIEQCWFMDREVFETFVENNQPGEEAQNSLDAIRKKYKLTPMEDPFAYIHELQDSFAYDAIQFPPDYYEWVEEPAEPRMPEWKVTWDGDFFHTDDDSEGAEPVPVNARFQWAGLDWYVPEVYAFDCGVILYLLGRADPELVVQHDYEDFLSPEALERLMAENPLDLQVRPELYINEIALRPSGSSGMHWIPGQGFNHEGKWVLEHYELDLGAAWQINRIRFFWPVCGPMDISKMRITMIQEPFSVSGTHFKTPEAGNRVILTHPDRGTEYTLHIDELTKENVDYSRFHDQSMEYPSCYTQMTFRIEPNLSRNQFRIVDCARGDRPRYRDEAYVENGTVTFSVGIIGGAHGPTAVIMGKPNAPVPQTHIAISAPHFEHPEQIEWRIVFQEKPNADLTVSLL